MSDWRKGPVADEASDTTVVEAVVVDAVIRTAETMALNDVLNAALEEAGYASVPSDGEELERFLFGPLYARAAAALGVDYAGRVVKAALTAVPKGPKRTASSVFRALDLSPRPTLRRAQRDTEPDLEPVPTDPMAEEPYRALLLLQDLSLQTTLAMQLEKTGAVVSSAAGRALAREVAREIAPDVIVVEVGASADLLSLDEAQALGKGGTPIIALSDAPLAAPTFARVFQHPCSATSIARAVVTAVTNANP